MQAFTVGAPVKHQWLRDMEVGSEENIPADVKTESIRVLVSRYGKETGKKFSVSSTLRKIRRLA